VQISSRIASKTKPYQDIGIWGGGGGTIFGATRLCRKYLLTVDEEKKKKQYPGMFASFSKQKLSVSVSLTQANIHIAENQLM
jgi:hypothetical protein